MFEVIDLSVSTPSGAIIDRLSFSAPSPGVLSIIGPGGAGKSTVLRAVAGTLDDGLTVAGEVRLNGQPIQRLPAGKVGWFPQYIWPSRVERQLRTRMQREGWSRDRLTQLLAFLDEPRRLHVLDEPTAGLDEAHAAIARTAIRTAAHDAFVLMVTHNRNDCIGVGGSSIIFAAGRLIEQGASERLFAAPLTEAGRRYVETGYLTLPRPVRATAVDGIWCVERGFLYGMSRPGLVAEADRQYSQLRESGVRHLVCLEEAVSVQQADLDADGIELHHFAVIDMRAPSFEQAYAFCLLAERAIQRGEGVAFHCKGGLGRTGTALACTLVWLGEHAACAVAKVRSSSPLAIQSEEQMDFIHRFSDHIRSLSNPAAIAAT